MLGAFEQHVESTLREIRSAGLWKPERVLDSPQRPDAELHGGAHVMVLCANNYLGLADNPRIIAAAHAALDRWGYGMASVRFICGTQEQHKELEHELSDFLSTEDSILYSSCFDANGGIFETLLGVEDAIISDELNHASIIDGIRLCKAQRFRYKNRDMADLEAQLRAAQGARHRRRIFYGWLHRASKRDLRSGRALQRVGHGGRFARRRLRRQERARHS
jgi:glycine C-acetyltransferase